MKKIALWVTVALILFVVIISGEKLNQTKPTEDNNNSYSTPAETSGKQSNLSTLFSKGT